MELLAAARVDPPASAKAGGAPDHYHQFRSRVVPCPDPIDPGRLRAALEELAPRVLRAKGFVVTAARKRGADPESGPEWMVVQASGRTAELEHWRPPPDRAPPSPGIVFIGLDDLPAAEELRTAVHRASVPTP